MAHKGFGGAAAVNTFKPHHKQRLAGQLPPFFELDFRRLTPLRLRSQRGPGCVNRSGKSLAGFTRNSPQPLDPHDLADAEPLIALRHAIRRALCR